MKSYKVLSESELKVFINELSSPRLIWLSDDEIHNFIIELLQEISLLTGADVYESEFKNQMLARTIRTLLESTDDIMNLTIKEVRHAFYLNHNGAFEKVHTMYGKPISADYVGNVLKNYREYKIRPSEVNWKIRAILNPPPEKLTPVLTIEDWKRFIQDDYERYQRSEVDYIFLTYDKYVIMRKLRIIIYPTLASWKKWFELALKRRELNAFSYKPASDAEKLRKRNQMTMYNQIRESGVIPSDEHFSTIRMLRKMVYFRFFQLLQEAGIGKIFEEVSHTEYHEEWGMRFVPLQNDAHDESADIENVA